MRPKKPILVYCADRELLAVIAFVLRLHPYDVAAVNDSKDATMMIAEKDAAFSCAILIHSRQGDPAGRVIHHLLEIGSNIRLLLVDRVGDLAPSSSPDMVLYGRNTTMAHILAALPVLCRRKPGPPASPLLTCWGGKRGPKPRSAA